MRVRALSASGDMQFGQGQRNFFVNRKEGVGQKVQTRLGLYVGDWFLNTLAGTAWRTQVLGRRTDATRDPMLRARILGTVGVTGIDGYASQLNRTTRKYAMQTTINTVFGQVLVATAVAGPNGDVRNSR